MGVGGEAGAVEVADGGGAGETVPAGKPIRLSGYAAGYRERRGFAPDEVEAAIRGSEWEPARGDRIEASIDLPFGSDWNGRRYATKRVRAVFVDEPDEIVVVTVYTYYF